MTSLTLVIPVHNEQENIEPLAREIETALADIDPWECIWIEDGSTDASQEVLTTLRKKQKAHRILSFPEQRGQSAATIAGILAARFPLIGMLDGDGQNDPADLPRMIGEMDRTGADLVIGRRARREDTFLRRLSSRAANRIRSMVTRDGVNDIGCSTRVGRREALKLLPHFNGVHRFIPTIIKLGGGIVCEVDVHHRPRRSGRSKYGVRNRLGRGLIDVLGVKWLMSRKVQVRAIEITPNGDLDG